MHIMLVTASPPGSAYGSETTSIRWEHLLGQLGHQVEPTYAYGKSRETYADPSFDLMIAIGAAECDTAISAYLGSNADRPLVVALNCHDLYQGLDTRPAVMKNIERANACVVFHERALERIPKQYRSKTRVILQSVELPEGGVDAIPAPPHREANETSPRRFEVCVANHLEAGKDPLRCAKAVRLLSEESTIQVVHIGRILDARWEEQVHREHETNERYEWLGEVPWTRALQIIKNADVLATTPSLGGGGNVISESIVLGTPVIASKVPGNVGILGEDYPGLFEPKNEHDLAALLSAAEGGTRFINQLRGACEELKPRFDMSREKEGWRQLFDELGQ